MGSEGTAEFPSPQTTPLQVLTPASAVAITPILCVDIVWGRSDYDVDGFILQRSQTIDAVLVTQI
jgi:hypothetical protein